MKTISISIPYVILSTQQHIDGRRQIHALTPFGCIDISAMLIDGMQNSPLFDVTVEGNLYTWILDDQMPSAFRDALFHLVGKISLLHGDWSIRRDCQLIVHFKGATENLTVTGHLNPVENRWQAEVGSPETGHYRHCA